MPIVGKKRRKKLLASRLLQRGTQTAETFLMLSERKFDKEFVLAYRSLHLK
jgi:hypothetical protein